jgi:hypothetical protein
VHNLNDGTFDVAQTTSPGANVIIGYVCSVNIATLSFTLVDGGIVLFHTGASGLGSVVTVAMVAAVFFWVIAFVTAILPVTLTYTMARWFQIRSIFYYLACGALTGAALAPIFVRVDWHEDDPPFLEEWLRYAPMFAAIGACAAAMFWYKTGRYITYRSRTVP